MFKYTLITSQYYYSRHSFIVEHTDDFIEQARACVQELIDHKRDDEAAEFYQRREFPLGDLDPKYADGPIRHRYNINDAGDIYLQQSNSLTDVLGEAKRFWTQSQMDSKGYQKKRVVEAVSHHHSYSDIRAIVEKHFTIL